MKKLSAKIAQHNNVYLKKHHSFAYKHHRMLTYLVDENLNKKKTQPAYIRNGQVKMIHETGMVGIEWMFLQICQKGSPWLDRGMNSYFSFQCRFLHHRDPYLMLGPLKEEQKASTPYLVIFHDILTEPEMIYLKELSRPNLSQNRTYDNVSGASNFHDFKSGKARRIIHKTSQTWISEVEWPELNRVEDWVGRKYIKLKHNILWKLNKKISLATGLVTDVHGSASDMQVTNYGLGGLCEGHIDPVGLMEHDELLLKQTRPDILVHGDILATFMAWLSDTEGGGGTAFVSPGYEGLILPEKGAAAFWIDLYSDGMRDRHSKHAGCPVLKGSKWILNKWINMYGYVKEARSRTSM